MIHCLFTRLVKGVGRGGGNGHVTPTVVQKGGVGGGKKGGVGGGKLKNITTYSGIFIMFISYP